MHLDRKKLLVILISVSGILALDQITKVWAIGALKGRAPSSYLGDFFRLGYAENMGAFLGLGKNLPDNIRFLLLTLMVAVFLVVLLIFLIRTPTTFWNTLGLSLILGGGVSNLLDRLFRTEGRVVDFMNMGIGPVRTGIFNFADVAIMVGLGLILFEPMLLKNKSKAQKPS